MNRLEKLSREYARILRERLGEPAMRALVEGTMSADETTVTFCKRDMAMVDAWSNVAGSPLRTPLRGVEAEVYHSAWAMAADNNYWMEESR